MYMYKYRHKSSRLWPAFHTIFPTSNRWVFSFFGSKRTSHSFAECCSESVINPITLVITPFWMNQSKLCDWMSPYHKYNVEQCLWFGWLLLWVLSSIHFNNTFTIFWSWIFSVIIWIYARLGLGPVLWLVRPYLWKLSLTRSNRSCVELIKFCGACLSCNS